MKDHLRWEVQWHPANGARIRRLSITSRGVRSLIFTLGIAGWVVVAGGVLAGLDVLLTRFETNLAKHQNTALRAQQETLREQAFGLSGRLIESVERGRRMARLAGTPSRFREGQDLRLPARDAGNEAILAWLSEQDARLETLGKELTEGQSEMGMKQALAPVPVDRGTVPMRNPALLQVADMGSARRRESTPPTR